MNEIIPGRHVLRLTRVSVTPSKMADADVFSVDAVVETSTTMTPGTQVGWLVSSLSPYYGAQVASLIAAAMPGPIDPHRVHSPADFVGKIVEGVARQVTLKTGQRVTQVQWEPWAAETPVAETPAPALPLAAAGWWREP